MLLGYLIGKGLRQGTLPGVSGATRPTRRQEELCSRKWRTEYGMQLTTIGYAIKGVDRQWLPAGCHPHNAGA